MANFGSVKEFKPEDMPGVVRQLTGDALRQEVTATQISSLNIEIAEAEVTLGSGWVDLTLNSGFSAASGSTRFRRLDDGRVEIQIAATVDSATSFAAITGVPEALVPAQVVASGVYSAPFFAASVYVDNIGEVGVRSTSSISVGAEIYASLTYTPKFGLDAGYRTGFPIEIPVKMKTKPKAVFASNGCYGIKWDWNGRLRILDASGLPAQKKVKLQVVLLGE